MRYGYIRTRSRQDVDLFIEHAAADKIFVDLVDRHGKTSGVEMQKMFQILSEGDTVVVRTLTNVCRDIQELCSFLGSMKQKGAHLSSLYEPDKASRLLSDEAFDSIVYVAQFWSQQNAGQTRKTGRPALSFPDGFYDVYERYRTGMITAKEAADELQIELRVFYALVRVFE